MPEVDTLIVDSAPIIKDALSLNSISSKIMTVPEVFKELRDAKTRLVLQTLPFDIAQKTPAEVYVSRIIQFSKKTGDFASLSMPDIKVLALTLQMHTEIVGDQYLRKEPVNPMILSVGSQVDDLRTNAKPKETLSTVETPDASLISENLTQELKSMSISSPLKKNECPSDFSQSSLDAVTVAPSEVVDDDASDDEGWITPEILAKEKQQKTDSGKAKIISVACMTDDFAMQNVLLQMKLPLISTDGMRIKRLKSWLLRCHACFKYCLSKVELQRSFQSSFVHHAETAH